jgi:hypothetical protein
MIDFNHGRDDRSLRGRCCLYIKSLTGYSVGRAMQISLPLSEINTLALTPSGWFIEDFLETSDVYRGFSRNI